MGLFIAVFKLCLISIDTERLNLVHRDTQKDRRYKQKRREEETATTQNHFKSFCDVQSVRLTDHGYLKVKSNFKFWAN